MSPVTSSFAPLEKVDPVNRRALLVLALLVGCGNSKEAIVDASVDRAADADASAGDAFDASVTSEASDAREVSTETDATEAGDATDATEARATDGSDDGSDGAAGEVG